MLDNSDMVGKIAVRQWALERVGGLGKARVLELYGGAGHMWEACYQGAAAHLSIDHKPGPGPNRLVGDNRQLLPSVIGEGWNLIDADAYADPWLICADVARLIEPGLFYLVVTCGIARSLKTGKGNTYVRKRIGYEGLPIGPGLFRWYDDIVRWVVADWRRFGVRVGGAVRVDHSMQPTGVCYWGMVVEKTA